MSQVLNLRADSPNLKTVLVVEDEPALRDLLTKRLKQLECHFVTANDGAEGLQMRRDELRVEERVAPRDQARDEMDEGDLRGIAGAVEHAFAEEAAAEGDAVEAACQPSLGRPTLDAVHDASAV